MSNEADKFVGVFDPIDNDPNGVYLTLEQDFGFQWGRHLVIAPAGVKTDGLSVPKFARWFVAPMSSPLRRAAVPHDVGYGQMAIIVDLVASAVCAAEALATWAQPLRDSRLVFVHQGVWSRKDWDKCMLAAMYACRREATKKPTKLKIRTVYGILRAFGWCAWNKHRRRKER